MFNRYFIGGNTKNVKAEVHLSQPSTGFIQKSNPVSRFIRFQRGSEIERLLFPTNPTLVPRLTYTEDYHTKQEEVIILQICIFGDDYMLAEYVFKKDITE